ncbi:MAG: T9SS type A sorting domain-containing protein, partial [Gemmatimonadetes bacterium]|nr:T9SS type A sorting domain-containing protein [Gemmatimonadota bacterium]
MPLVRILVGLLVFVHAGTAQEQTISGKIRLADGRPVARAKVTLFDLANLHKGAVARAMTDGSGFFALPLASLGGSSLPQGFALGPNYPNPFNPSTVIPYQIPTVTHVRLDVFNVLGQHVATLVDAEQPAGSHTAQWDATNAVGQAIAAGVYFYRLTVRGGQQTQRMVLLDGQAGIAASAATSASVSMATDAAERAYGLVVSSGGLTTYTDAAFGVREGMAAVELVLDAAPLTSGTALAEDILGDVNNDRQVSLEDAMLVAVSRSNPSIAMPNNGSIRLGDVNGDGQVNETDVLVLMRYISNPLDGALPAGVGQRIGRGKRTSDDSSEPRNLTNHEAADSWPAWSSDGRHIAFSSNRDGDHEIYVMGS